MTNKPEKPKLFYFDTNIFGDLLDPENENAPQFLNIIETKISERSICIVPSFETLQEILIIPEDNTALSAQRQKLYRRIVDWPIYLLKPTHEIIRDDILSFAKKGNRDVPFVRPDHELWDYINPIRFGEITLSQKELLSKTADFNRSFVEKVIMRPTFKNTKQIREIIKNPNFNAKMQWMTVWQPGKTAYIMTSSFASRFNVLKECEERGIGELLNLPTIRMTIGYILHWWYMRIIQGTTNVEISSTMDSRHAICAGALGNIVTSDRKLQATIKHIPDHSVKALSLGEFIAQIQ